MVTSLHNTLQLTNSKHKGAFDHGPKRSSTDKIWENNVSVWECVKVFCTKFLTFRLHCRWDISTFLAHLHCVRFAWWRLTIGKNGSVISTKHICGNTFMIKHSMFCFLLWFWDLSSDTLLLPFTICWAQAVYTCSWVVLDWKTRSNTYGLPCR